MSIQIVSGSGGLDQSVPAGFKVLHTGAGLRVAADEPAQIAQGPDGRKVIVFGRIAGLAAPAAMLSENFDRLEARWTDRLEGRFAVVAIGADGRAAIVADRFGKRDLFVSEADGVTIIGSDLSLIPNPARGGYDGAALAHTMTYYGHRPPKRHTIYKAVQRLGVGDVAIVDRGKLKIKRTKFTPVATANYGDRENEIYVDLFLDHLKQAGSESGNVVLLSSGWDSTSILAGLVHVFGRSKVRAVIGRMLYSERSGNCNRFEIERAHAIADYFGVKLEMADLDHGIKGGEWLEKCKPVFLDNQYFSITGVNHYILLDKVRQTAANEETVFAGEISDGAHNLGFSQYVTMFHPSYEFREYADKMASYLFGPTFVGQFLENKHEADIVYQLFRGRAEGVAFDKPASSRQERLLQILVSFFLRNGRMPLWSLDNSKLLSPSGRAVYTRDLSEGYLAEFSDAKPEELYSCYLHLYNSFHWQGSTVATLNTLADHFGLQMDVPYWDSRIQDFFYAMPEGWGRGLDLKSTKYPLKWMLANRLDYPMHLQTGPHSYTYDVDPSFNHNFELFYHSNMGPAMRRTLKDKPYREILSPGVFDLNYADGLVDAYLGGQELRGAACNDLVSLGLLSQTGWRK